MRQRPVIRQGLAYGAVLFLVGLGWQAFSGGLRQISRSRTVGQKVETVSQLASGLLSVVVALTCFRRRGWAQPVRSLWRMTLVTAAGLSALVWGPPMPAIGVLFTAIALWVSQVVIWALGAERAD